MKLKLGESRLGAAIPLLWLNLFVTCSLHGKALAAAVFGIICTLSFAAMIRAIWEDAKKENTKP